MSEPVSLTPEQIALQRRLKWVVIILGILLIIGFGALVIGMAMQAKKVVSPQTAPVLSAPGTFEVPKGMEIAEMQISDNLIVLRLEGGGRTRLVMIDSRSGKVRGTMDSVQAAKITQ